MNLKVLIVADSSPYPAKDGKRQRNLAFLNALLTAYDVDYLILGNHHEFENTKSVNSPNLKFYYLDQMGFGRFSKFLGWIYRSKIENQKLLEGFLLNKSYHKIICRHATLAKDLPIDLPIIIDEDDFFEELMISRIRTSMNLYKKLRYYQIFRLNLKAYYSILNRANAIILAKEQPTPYTTYLLPNLPFQAIFTVKNREFRIPLKNNILFVGKLSYPPNAFGISWFLEEVWPNFNLRNPNIQLTIVSINNPSEILANLIAMSPNVKLMTNVPEMDEVYYQHSICLVPIFFGSGSNIKLTEALYYFRKVVSTPFGIRGFERFVESGLISIASTSNGWLESIEKLLLQSCQISEFNCLEEYFSFSEWTDQVKRILDEN